MLQKNGSKLLKKTPKDINIEFSHFLHKRFLILTHDEFLYEV